MKYRVVYAIDLEADSSLEAVLQAYAAMIRFDVDPVFDVYLGDVHVAQVDLGDLPSAREATLGDGWSLMSPDSPLTSAA